MPIEYKSFLGQLDAAGEGSISAEFSIFDRVDQAGDVTLRSFFKHGQAVPMVHDHDWSTVTGKGVIDVQTTSAWFNGNLFLDTIAGREAYTTMKHLGELQQFSYGYNATDTARGQVDGKSVRLLKGGQTYEVSDTLVGCVEGTGLRSLKSLNAFGSSSLSSSYEQLSDAIADAMTEQELAPGDVCVSTIQTFPDYAHVAVKSLEHEPTYYRVEYTLDAEGEPLLSNLTEVGPEVVFAPADEPGLTFAGQSQKALAAVERLAVRTSALAALRGSERKSGRVLSAASHAKLSAVHDGIAGHLAMMAGVLKAHDPGAPVMAEAAAKKELGRRLYIEHLQNEARLNGVAV